VAPSSDSPMRVCFFGTYEQKYPCNALLLRWLEAANIHVIECHVEIWEGREQKAGSVVGCVQKILFLCRYFIAAFRLSFRYFLLPPTDLLLVGYIGQLDVLLLKCLSYFSSAPPLVFQPLLSVHQTFVEDRGLLESDSFFGRLIFKIDRLAFRSSDLILIDTKAHGAYLQSAFSISPDRFKVLTVGFDDQFFTPTEEVSPPPFRVLFYGKFSPLHGIEIILHAAKLLEDDPDIRFLIIGEGQLSASTYKLSRELQVQNIEFRPWVAYNELRAAMASVHLSLGIFGTTPRADLVIPNKVFQALACRKAVITGDSRAIAEIFEDGKHLLLAKRGNPEDLAEKVRILKNDGSLRRQLAREGCSFVREKFSATRQGETLKSFLQTIV